MRHLQAELLIDSSRQLRGDGKRETLRSRSSLSQIQLAKSGGGDLLPEILNRVSKLETSVKALLAERPTNRPTIRGAMISWEVAGQSVGKTRKQAYELIYRENRRPSGMRIRTARGGVNREDWEAFLQERYSRNLFYRDICKRALEN